MFLADNCYPSFGNRPTADAEEVAKIPSCIVPGCPREAANNLGVRLRRPDTTAIWAPNTDAYVCDEHAAAGARLTIDYEARESGEIEVAVRGVNAGPTRTTRIREHPYLGETLVEKLKE